MDIDNTQDTLDVRDIIERVEALEEFEDDAGEEDADELRQLRALLEDLQGNGGDHEWRGDWYPGTLVRDSYWTEYVQEFAEDVCGDAVREARWPCNCIDWERAGRELQMDYTCAEFAGVTYWYR